MDTIGNRNKVKRQLQQIISSIRSRIFLLFTIFNIVSLLFSDIIIYHSASHILFEQACDIIENNLHSVSFSLESALLQVDEAVSDLSLNKDITEGVQQNFNLYDYDYMLVNDKMRSLLNKSLLTNHLLQSVYLVNSDFKYFCKSEIHRTFSREELLQAEWSQVLPISEDNIWYVIPGVNNVAERISFPTLTMFKRIYNFTDNKVVGYISANISFGKIRDYMSKFQIGETGYLVLCDTNGKIAYHPDNTLNGEFYQELNEINISAEKNTFVNNNMIVTCYKSDRTGLTYIAYIPLQEILLPALTIQKTIFVLILFSIFISLGYAAIISKRIYNPIKILRTHMQMAAKGDTTVQIQEIRYDEMGTLYENFNDMIQRIDQLISEVYMQRLTSDELRIENLQIQLKPHFLYNVLDSIHWAARENNMDDVCQMTFLLSRYFQKNLDNGHDRSTITVIASAMHSYMELQKIRHGEKLSYTISVEPTIANCIVPKYLFQPLLENAVLHGIEKRTTAGFCQVVWEKEENRIHFYVEDNGPGIEPEKLASIQAALKKNNRDISEYFALCNINSQLNLFYGEEYHLIINNIPENGVRIEFYLPMESEKMNV